MQKRMKWYPVQVALLALALCWPLAAAADSTTSNGRQQLVEGLVSLELPAKAWSLTEEGATAPEIAYLKLAEGSGRGNLSLQPVPGVPFEQLVPAVESAMASKYQEFETISAETITVEERPVFRIECSFKDEGGSWKALGLFTKTSDDQLFSLTFRAHPDDMSSLQGQLDQLVASLQVDGHHLAADAAK